MKHGIRSLILTGLAVLGAMASALAVQEELPPPLDAGTFQTIPDSCRPWCYYWWLKGNVDEGQITRDLEAMRSMGFGGLLLFDSRGYHEDAENHIPVPMPVRHEFMSDSWRGLVMHLLREADRLGLKVSMNISDTGGHLRGPWDLGRDGPKCLVWSEGNLNGPKEISIPLDLPENQPYYQDEALLAVKISVEPKPEREVVRLGETWGGIEKFNSGGAQVLETIDLTEFVHDGVLEWTLPDGAWKILRFGTAVTGDTGSVDILNAGAIERYFNRIGGTILDEAGPLAGKTLTHFYNVSWEGSEPNWTDGFPEFFKQKRGYSILPYLPVLRGLIVGSGAVSQRFLTDYYKTVADAFQENCYQKIGRLCHDRGILWHSEDGGPWNRGSAMFTEGDMLSFWGQNDASQGEFWVSESGRASAQTNLQYASNASRIHGKNLTAVEAFTHMVRHWTISPKLLKQPADAAFIDGANWFLWHTFTASPDEAGKPGYEYFAGTHVNRNVTWAGEVNGMTDYLARCQYLLRQGTGCADFCLYTSDKNYLSWGHRREWTGNLPTPAPAWNPFDRLDTESLVHRLRWDGTRFVLDGTGMTYRFLVLDPDSTEIPLEAIEKIVSLAEAGGIVVLGEKRPVQCRGLSDGLPGDAGDKRVQEAAARLWGDGSLKIRSFGKGKIYSGVPVSDVLAAEGILPDAFGPFEAVHRKSGEASIYFVAGSGTAEMIFREEGIPEFWNPMDGTVYRAAHYGSRPGGRTSVTLDLPKNGSIFVVFRKEPVEAVQPETVFDSRPLEGPWEASFDEQWGGQKSKTFETLTPWNEDADDSIRYYSGTAVYRKEFSLGDEEANRPIRLSLGEVGVIAHVCLNGEDCGVVWTGPWEADLTGKTLPGTNRLEIAVTNVWANRLIGDAGLKPEERITKTNVQYFEEGIPHRAHQGFSPSDSLVPSGLTGPVIIKIGQ